MKNKKLIIAGIIIATFLMSTIFIQNANAIPVDYYVANIEQYYWPAVNCDNSGNIIGSSSDQQYGHLYTDGNSNMGYVVCLFNDISGGNFFVNAYSSSGYDSNLQVYVMYENLPWEWYQLSDLHVSNTSPTDIYVGTTNLVMAMLICVYDDGNPADLYIDNAFSSEYYFITNDWTSGANCGTVENPENVTGPLNDGQYACLTADYSGDVAEIVGTTYDWWASGDSYLRVYSESGYNSHLTIQVTALFTGDPGTLPWYVTEWYTVVDCYINSTTPQDIHFDSAWHGVKIMVDNVDSSPSKLYVDSLMTFPS